MAYGDLVPRIITRFGVRMRRPGEERFRPATPVNLSETGLCIRLPGPVNKGDAVAVEIDLERDAAPMRLNGVVAWVRGNNENGFYCGIGIRDFTAAQVARIRAYVEEGAETLLGFFAEFPLFAAFSIEDCRRLLRIVTLRELDQREVLYYEGDHEADFQGLFIIQSGLISVHKGRRLRPDRQLVTLSAGQVFGEASLVADQPHTATIVAVNPSRLIQINKLGFRLVRRESAEMALKVMDIVAATLAWRLSRTTTRLFSPVRLYEVAKAR